MGSMLTGALIVGAALMQGPPTGTQCRVEYHQPVGGGVSIGNVTIQPGATATLNKVVLKVVNREERSADVRLTPPVGPQHNVTLDNFGSTDPPALQYVGNWALKSVHCPHLYPSPTHMWDAGETLAAVREEFQLDPVATAVLIRPEFADVTQPTLGAGAVATLQTLFPGQNWIPSNIASVLSQAQYPAAAIIDGLVRNNVVQADSRLSQFPVAMQVTGAAGYSAQDVLGGARTAANAMEHWDRPNHSPALSQAPVQTRWMLEAGFAYDAISQALQSEFSLSPKEFTDIFFYYTREIRGAEAVGKTARSLRDVFGVSDVGIANHLRTRSRASEYPGPSAAPSSESPDAKWSASREELSLGIYASQIQRCALFGEGLVQVANTQGTPISDETVARLREEYGSDAAGAAHCLLMGHITPSRVLEHGATWLATSGEHQMAPGFRTFGVTCDALVDVLAINGREIDPVFRWVREAEYPQMKTCIDKIGQVFSTFPLHLYAQALGVGAAANVARQAGWPFEQTADSIQWFRTTNKNFGPMVRTYRLTPEAAFRYLWAFATEQQRTDVFDFQRYLAEAFAPDQFCPVLFRGRRGEPVQKDTRCEKPGGVR